MGLFYFFVGLLAGILLLAALPFVIALIGAVFAITLFTALPLILALLILFGVIAAAPTLAYGLAIAALLILLWAHDRRRRQPPPP